MEAVGLRADVEQLATDSLRSVARKWLHGKVPYQIIVRTGAPVSGLLKAEAELSIDLVVMSTHGRSGSHGASLTGWSTSGSSGRTRRRAYFHVLKPELRVR